MSLSRLGLIALLSLPPLAACGCGTTKQAEATHQLLASDAVDRSIARIDFTPLRGQKVFFDKQFIINYKGIGFVNSEYVVSSLRQQMFAAGCLMQEKIEDADFVVEGRIGTLGNDEHAIIYGIPANSGLTAASTVIPGSPPLPAIPEISIARKEDQMGAAKIAAFAYEKTSREIVWQSGLSVARSTAKDLWFLGAGPFERGTIYNGWQFAGSRLKVPLLPQDQPISPAVTAYGEPMLYQPVDTPPVVAKAPKEKSEPAWWSGAPQKPAAPIKDNQVQPASAEVTADESKSGSND